MATKYDAFVRNPQRRRLYEQEALAFHATELISELIEQSGMQRAEIAQRIGKSRAYVTQLLRGSRNMTLHTLADMAFALDARIELRAVPADHRVSTAPRPGDETPTPVQFPQWIKSAPRENLRSRESCEDETFPVAA